MKDIETEIRKRFYRPTVSSVKLYREKLRAIQDKVAEVAAPSRKRLFKFSRVVVKIKGAKGEVEVEQKKRTSGGHSLSMDKDEMSDYINRCAELTGYPLPTKEELEAMGYISNY